MWQPGRTGWWVLLAVALIIVGAWPPERDSSLAMKLVNWAVDPFDRLPVLPPQLGFGVSDDYLAVEAHDAQVRRYDAMYNSGGWTRTRLQLKVATESVQPVNRAAAAPGVRGCGGVCGVEIQRPPDMNDCYQLTKTDITTKTRSTRRIFSSSRNFVPFAPSW